MGLPCVLLCLFAAGCVGLSSPGGGYTFTMDDQVFTPTVISLDGDPSHPAPGDVILANYYLGLTLGDERVCHFHDSLWEDGRLFLEDRDGRRTLVGVQVLEQWQESAGKSVTINPLATLTAKEINALRGIYLGAWPEGTAERLRHIDPTRTCVTISHDAHTGTWEFPPLPDNLRYLRQVKYGSGGMRNYARLQGFRSLRVLELEDAGEIPISLIAGNRDLRCLTLNLCRLTECSALQALSGLRQLGLPMCQSTNWASVGMLRDLRRLDLSWSHVDSIDFVRNLRQLEELDVSETGVSDLTPVDDLPCLRRLCADDSAFPRLPGGPLPALRELSVMIAGVKPEEVARFRQAHPGAIVRYGLADEFRRALAGVTRLRVRTGGSSIPQPSGETTLLEVGDTNLIHQFVDTMQLRETDHYAFSCACGGNPTFEFYAGDALVATVSLHHGVSLRWADGPWPTDVNLTRQGSLSLVAWLKAHGCRDVAIEESSEPDWDAR